MKMVEVGWGYKDQMHWACAQCIVRPMCKEEGCFMTKLFHYYCLTCKKNKTCKKKCESVERTELFDRVFRSSYGPLLKESLRKSVLEQSLLYQISKFDPQEDTTFRWWTE